MVDARLPGRLARQRGHPAAGDRRPVDAPSAASARTRSTWDDYVKFEVRSRRRWSSSCKACVDGSHLNIIVVGRHRLRQDDACSTYLSTFIPETERIVTIEDAAELQLSQPHVVPPGVAPAEHRRQGATSPSATWSRNALRMRPDRIIVGECRGARDARHAPGDEHRPRRLAHHDPRQQRPRRRCSRIETMVHDGRLRSAGEGDPPAVQHARSPSLSMPHD